MSFKIFGIKISVSFLFILMLTFLLIIDKTGYMSLSLIAMLIHEAGHIIAMHFVKSKPKEIDASHFGLLIVGKGKESPKQTLLITFAGPLFNLLTFILFWIVFKTVESVTAGYFAVINLILCLVNLLPLNSLDGGNITLILLTKLFGEKAKFIFSVVTVITASVLTAFSVFLFFKVAKNVSLLLLCIYLFVVNIFKSI